MKTNKTILCIDDNEDTTELLKAMFEETGFEVTSCPSAEACSDHLKRNDLSALILDFRLPDQKGTELCREVRAANPQLPIVFFTGEASPESRWEGLKAGANNYLVKPNDLENIVPVVTGLINQA